MEPAIRFPFSDLPTEIALIVFKYAAKPTFSQKEEYKDKNPYATALSLCLVSRLARLTILPEFLHIVLLPERHNLKAFAFTLLMQKVYAKQESHLFFDYIPAVQRLWIGHSTDDLVWNASLEIDMTLLLPVLLAVPTLAIEVRYLDIIVKFMEASQPPRTDPNVDHEPSPFPWKTQTLTVEVYRKDVEIFHKIHKKSAFLASIPHVTYLIDLSPDSDIFRDISRGLKSPEIALKSWVRDIPWAYMESLETFSMVYPYLAPPYKIRSYIDQTRGVDLHVERLTVSAPLYRQNPESFPWVTAPFPVTLPGERIARTDGLSFKVTHGQGHFWRFYFTWEKVWACGLTD
jgi:hypothetical protein